jgi:hypothetical protein
VIKPVAMANKMSTIIVTEAISLRPMNLLIDGLLGSFFSMTIMALNKLNTMNRINPPINNLINIYLPLKKPCSI